MNKIKLVNYLFVVSIIFSVISITSCNKEDMNIENKVSTIPVLPVFDKSLPDFPMWVSHVLQREFYNKKNQKETNLDYLQYIEQRLIELYPETAYEGMMNDAKLAVEEFYLAYEEYEKELKQYYIDNNLNLSELEEDNFQEFTTLEAEIEYMTMTEEEIALFLELEDLATKKSLLTREEIENYTFSKGGPLIATYMSSAAVIAGYSVWRVLQSRDRAEAKKQEFYGNAGAGSKGDAFRHIYVSVLLRRYITRVGADLVMSTYEVLHPNEAKDKYMDLHNNKVGRHTQYWTFRGDYIKDKYKWELWATRAKNWVNGNNYIYFQYWETASDATIILQEKNASDYKYIYYAN